MAQQIDEADLEPLTESDVESPAETAEARRTGIAATPLPETQRPPIWNPKSRAATRFATGVALPSIAAAPFTGGASILAGMGGAAVAEGVDYAMSPEEERPSFLGAGTRVAAQGAIPLALGKVAGKLAPLLKKVPALPKIPLGPAKEAVSKVGGQLVKAVGEAGGLPKIAGARTEEAEIRHLLLRDLEFYSPGIMADDVVQLFRGWFGDPKKALGNRALEMARDRFNIIADAIEEEAKATGGSLKLTRLEELLKNFGKEAFAGVETAARPAFRQARNALHEIIVDFLKTTHGEEAAGQYAKLTNAIRTRLDVAEGLGTIMRSNPVVAIGRILAHPDGLGAVQAFDAMNGTTFLPTVQKIGRQLAERSAAKAARAPIAAAATTLRASQNEARNLLKGLIIAASATSITGGSIGGVGGFLLGILAGRMKGAVPLEKLAAGAAVGAAKVARPVTAAIGKGAEALFGGATPVARPLSAVAESDLIPEEETP